MVRTRLYNDYDIDNYPLGTNAIVAVISYTVSGKEGERERGRERRKREGNVKICKNKVCIMERSEG